MNNMIYRMAALKRADVNEEDRTVKFIGSSEYPAKRWGITEILSHEKGAINSERMDTVASLLLNHDSRDIAGSIVDFKVVDDHTEVTARFTTTEKGENAFTEVKEGALRGISVGYSVQKWEVNEDETEYRAIEWTPYEFSLTPIPVDPTCTVGRDLEKDKQTFFASINRSVKEVTQMTTEPSTEDGKGIPAVTNEPVADLTALRKQAETIAREDAQHIARQAESLGLPAGDFIGMPRSEAGDAMIKAVATRDASAPVSVADVTVTADATDKRAEHFSDKLSQHRSVDVLLELARANGDEIYSRQDLAQVLLGKRALETSSSLGNVTVLAADKAMIKGFNSYQSWCSKIASTRTVSDFKTVHSAGLTFGAFNTPGEGNALTDLTADDIGDTGSIAFKGGIVQLTEEAVWNDELDLFLRSIQQLGYFGAREEDKVCIAALEAATFTGNSAMTAAFSLAAIKTGWTQFNQITDASGELIGLDPECLLLPPALYISGLEETTKAQGETTARIFADSEVALKPLNGRGLTDANDWYMFAGLGAANGLELLKHSAYATPKMEEIDAGNVIARKWKIKYPLGAMVNNLKTGAPIGILKSAVA